MLQAIQCLGIKNHVKLSQELPRVPSPAIMKVSNKNLINSSGTETASRVWVKSPTGIPGTVPLLCMNCTEYNL